jgi:hypothetical protein
MAEVDTREQREEDRPGDESEGGRDEEGGPPAADRADDAANEGVAGDPEVVGEMEHAHHPSPVCSRRGRGKRAYADHAEDRHGRPAANPCSDEHLDRRRRPADERAQNE